MTILLNKNDRSDASLAQESWAGQLTRPGISIFLFVLVLAGPIVHHWGEQQASRYALTAALWDQHSVVIDDYSFMLGRDRVVVDGVTYSDKAPGQPFLMVPVYGAYRLWGGQSPIDHYDLDADLGMWWVTFWSAAVPGALLATLMYRWAREVEERTALLATVTMALGTLLFVYSTILFGHVLAALFAFGMFLVIRKEGASWWRLAGAGALGGAAVLTEYPVALIVAVLAIAALARHGIRVVAVIAGGVPAALLLGLYHMRLFGSPFTFTYQWSAFSGPRAEVNELLGSFAGPSMERFLHVLLSPRGLLIATPVILVACLGLVPMWRKGWRFDAAIASSIVLVMLVIPSSWSNSYAGGAGPRYFAPALPFLVAPLALTWTRWRLLTAAAGAISILTMVTATFTEPQMATAFEAGLRYWLYLASIGDFEPNIYTVAFGGWGWLLYAGTVLVTLWLVIRSSQVHGREIRASVG